MDEYQRCFEDGLTAGLKTSKFIRQASFWRVLFRSDGLEQEAYDYAVSFYRAPAQKEDK